MRDDTNVGNGTLGPRAEAAHLGGGDRFGGLVEDDPLDRVAHIAPVEYVGDVGERDDDEAAGISRKRGLDPLLHGEKRQRILLVDAVSVADGDAHLADAPQTLFDQPLMPGMKRLVASDEQGRRLLRVERWAQLSERLLGPVLRRTFGA